MNVRIVSVFLLVIASSVLVGCASDPLAAQAEGVVRNGSFESPTADAPYVRMAPGLPLDGWTIADGSIDLVGNYWKAADGAQSIHIARGATVSQEILTRPGRTYELRFAAAANVSSEGDAPSKHLIVTWNDKSVDTIELDSRMHTRDEMGWRYYAYPVKATGRKSVLRFECQEKSEWGVALDSVRLIPIAQK